MLRPVSPYYINLKNDMKTSLKLEEFDSTLRAIGHQYKWGIKGVLRYGMATPREKAELLNQMLTEAGFVSTVTHCFV